MSLIRPFTGLRPDADRAAEVIAPPYDVLSSAEARIRAQDKPWSFLHISKPEIDLAPETDPYGEAVYAKGRENFQHMLQSGVLHRDAEDGYYVYRLVMGAHTQIGVVAAASVSAYTADRIRKHEHTQPDKEDDRVRQIHALNAQTGPVLLTYRQRSKIDDLVAAVVAAHPVVDVSAADGVRHSLWVVHDPVLISALTAEFDRLDCLYIADGHHRSAAAARVAETRRKANRHHTGKEPYNYFLAVIFPDTQMRILDYNRVVKDLNGLSPDEFLKRVRKAFRANSSLEPVQPKQPAVFGLYLKGQWYRLAVKPELIPGDDPVRRLDVSLLQEQLLQPVLGISDPRLDKRVGFVGGIRGVEELMRRVDSGEMAAAFSLYPTSLADLMAVADADWVMPPKSTWFEPKLTDGLVSHLLD